MERHSHTPPSRRIVLRGRKTTVGRGIRKPDASLRSPALGLPRPSARSGGHTFPASGFTPGMSPLSR